MSSYNIYRAKHKRNYIIRLIVRQQYVQCIAGSVLENITGNVKFYTTWEKIVDQEVLKFCNLIINKYCMSIDKIHNEKTGSVQLTATSFLFQNATCISLGSNKLHIL
jgi:tyrosyl-tRNA synthetase